MSIIDKITSRTQVADVNQLNEQELEFLLNILKQAPLLGEQVEMFYNLVVKLQNQYIERTK